MFLSEFSEFVSRKGGWNLVLSAISNHISIEVPPMPNSNVFNGLLWMLNLLGMRRKKFCTLIS